jgi:hypothetical protein
MSGYSSKPIGWLERESRSVRFAARFIDSLLDAVSTACPGREPSDQCSRRCRVGYRLDLRQLLAERAQGHLQVVINLPVEPLLRRGAERLAQAQRGVNG